METVFENNFMEIIKIIVNEQAFETLSSKFQEDVVFLHEELEDAVEVYSEVR